MGSEFGQDAEWNESVGLDWWLLDNPSHAAVQHLVRDLNALYKATPALYERDFTPDGFEWIDSNDADHNTLAYVRKGLDGKPVVVVVNFAGVPHEGYRLALPEGGVWREALNTDAESYGGSGVCNVGAIAADPVPWHGRSYSAEVRVPPLGAIVLVQD
jgi:1,4-alpha-glucan branching enzyme